MDRRNILSISPLYFEITSGLGKWLYRAARKHAGGNGVEGFTIGFPTLHQKSGSESTYPVFKKMLLELAKANALPDIALEAILDGPGEPKLKMVMRRFLDKPSLPCPALPDPPDTAPSPPPAFPATAPGQEEAEFVDSQLALRMIASAARGLRAEDAERRPPPLPRTTAPPRSAGRARARDVLDEGIYEQIRREFPGWDYDELMARFDTFLGANPLELPRNYSKRFYGFVREHHKRNKYKL
jgi:hypothetical protein